jgi:hypothetical protein
MTLQYVIEALVCLIDEFIRSIERQSFITDNFRCEMYEL